MSCANNGERPQLRTATFRRLTHLASSRDVRANDALVRCAYLTGCSLRQGAGKDEPLGPVGLELLHELYDGREQHRVRLRLRDAVHALPRQAHHPGG